jgi:two-component system sensor histidine kinase MtrB
MDPRRVRRVVRNLLGNAIEHGEGRPIVVTVDSDQQSVALGVRDYGLGMKPEDVERVFDRFWRADPSRTRTIGGTGLGLSIALGDARLHGGELGVWSELGRGTNFVLTLPRKGARLTGPSPIPLDPGDDSIAAVDDLGLTQPIQVPLADARTPDAASPGGAS